MSSDQIICHEPRGRSTRSTTLNWILLMLESSGSNWTPTTTSRRLVLTMILNSFKSVLTVPRCSWTKRADEYYYKKERQGSTVKQTSRVINEEKAQAQVWTSRSSGAFDGV